MPDVLSQTEIEALLAEMTTEAAPEEAAGEAAGDARPDTGGESRRRTGERQVIRPLHKRRRAALARTGSAACEPYDFRRPDKLSKENLRSLQMLHESFANYFTSSLSSHLRASIQVELVSVEQVPYEEYAKSESATLLTILNVAPLSGQAILEIDLGILFSMLDRLLGGTGAAGKISRDLTDIERTLATHIIEQALADLQTAWENVNTLEFEIASIETSTQFVQIVPGNDTVALIHLKITMGEFQGALTLCVPYLLIKPILGKLSTQRFFLSAHKKPHPLYAVPLARRLRTTRVACVARLGTSPLTVLDLARLHVGQILPLAPALAPDEERAARRIGAVDVVIGGHVKFHGKTGLRGKHLAVQIERVVAPTPDLIVNKEQS